MFQLNFLNLLNFLNSVVRCALGLKIIWKFGNEIMRMTECFS